MTDPTSDAALMAAFAKVAGEVDALDATDDIQSAAAIVTQIGRDLEIALQTSLDGSSLTGQALVRECRQRNYLSLEQAHAALQIFEWRDRFADPSHEPTGDEVSQAVRAVHAFATLAPGDGETAPDAAPAPVDDRYLNELFGSDKSPTDAAAADAAATNVDDRRSLKHIGLVVGTLFVLLLGAVVAVEAYRGRAARAMSNGIVAYNAGRREEARGDFLRAARQQPRDALPHIYLARLAREDGDLPTAGFQLKSAVELEPGNPMVQRELGALFLTRGEIFVGQQRMDLAEADYDAARRSYVRALQIDPNDAVATGYLGCSLMKLGRQADAAPFLRRAGPGPWSSCKVEIVRTPPPTRAKKPPTAKRPAK